MKKETSWDTVADWYHDLLKAEGTYQKEVILPNLLRVLELKAGETVLDLACGEGFFAREFSKKGVRVIGLDAAKKLIEIAKKNSPSSIRFEVGLAEKIPFLKDQSVDKAVVVLALQNLENVHQVFKEASRVLKLSGRIVLVLNHPAFRIPKASSWGWDEKEKIQYRRIDTYLSESREKIETHPSDQGGDYTWSFHRPLQFYFKSLEKNGFAVSRLEEWNSHKQSQAGPRAKAEDKARKEIPLFLMIEALKIR